MYKALFKRMFDIVFSIIGMFFFGILLLIIAPLIYFSDKGPVFYNAKRLGKNGKVFKMYKFRTMKVNAPDIRLADGSTYNGEDDPRVTKIGKILRKTSLDEIPQIINVLIGDMSFIGPRPDLPEHIEEYKNNEVRKLEASPGLSGYSQAYYRNSIPWKERIVYDIFYIDNISFLFDIKIVLKTVNSVFRNDSIYVNAVNKLEEKQDEFANIER